MQFRLHGSTIIGSGKGVQPSEDSLQKELNYLIPFDALRTRTLEWPKGLWTSPKTNGSFSLSSFFCSLPLESSTVRKKLPLRKHGPQPISRQFRRKAPT